MALDRPARAGQGRFYSYDFLEKLAGCDSADRIVPEWQDLAVCNEVRLARVRTLAY
jgi:hypothetical protein